MSALALFAAWLLALIAALPIGAALWAVGAQMLDAAAWQALWADPQTWRAWGMTLWTGLASTALAWITVAHVLASGFIRQQLGRWLSHLPALLATPHAAMAIGLVLWLSPSGWALRLVSPGLTGFDAPPPWFTTQDLWGLGLILALWLKEVPFLLWVAATQMQREELRRRWQAEYALAQTLGRTPAQVFAQIIWPQLAPRLRWPLLAVLAYGLTVVDMALIIGPATPPTLAVLAWQWLSDADLLTQSQGVAAAGWLTGTVLVAGVVTAWLVGVAPSRRMRGYGKRLIGVVLPHSPKDGLVGAAPSRRMLGYGQRLMLAWAAYLPKPGFVGGWPPNVVWTLILTTYAAIWFALTVGSVSGVWPFPQVWPELWTLNAWQQVASSAHTVWTTLGLGVASASVCLLWSVAWLELAPRRWQHALQPWFLLPLVLPSVLWVVGLYSLALHTRLEGQWLGLCLAHAVMVLPYVLLALVPAYQAVDPRQAALVASLGHGRWVYLWRVKWPLLKRAIASAWAVGFAVSVAQYLPTLYVGAGRFATVTTEAVTLAAGAQRSLMSAYAALQMLLPIAAFALAAWLGRPRRFEKIAPMKATP
ncbi:MULTISPECIES: ABC transporter permease [unclassified Limnohabitans]|uniref:ABC transporter permease n=1 Tax=unclassified Limnohabitans TaxID=2626134 RepID=UPI001E5ADC42|nr:MULTISPECIES: ABC transporter permease [unclassified Limnohabitans]